MFILAVANPETLGIAGVAIAAMGGSMGIVRMLVTFFSRVVDTQGAKLDVLVQSDAAKMAVIAQQQETINRLTMRGQA